jgi:hypothetical protein
MLFGLMSLVPSPGGGPVRLGLLLLALYLVAIAIWLQSETRR